MCSTQLRSLGLAGAGHPIYVRGLIVPMLEGCAELLEGAGAGAAAADGPGGGAGV